MEATYYYKQTNRLLSNRLIKILKTELTIWSKAKAINNFVMLQTGDILAAVKRFTIGKKERRRESKI